MRLTYLLFQFVSVSPPEELEIEKSKLLLFYYFLKDCFFIWLFFIFIIESIFLTEAFIN